MEEHRVETRVGRDDLECAARGRIALENDIDFSARPQEQSGFVTVLMTFLPFLLLMLTGLVVVTFWPALSLFLVS